MSMNIDAKTGDRVTFCYPGAGLACDQEQARQWLTPGTVYTVDFVDVHDWVTYVTLREIPDQSFNSVLFDTAALEEAWSPQRKHAILKGAAAG